jgi:hypothetical protein
MKILRAFIACIAIVAAFPALQGYGAGPEANTWGLQWDEVSANCQPGFDYCYEQIVNDLSTYTHPIAQHLP